MIPKIIHYCWFGGNPLPKETERCIESWKKYCPNYDIVCWNETNYDIEKNVYVRQAYKNKKWAFLTDYVRLDVVYRYGGVYLDTDVELIRNIDNLLIHECYMGMEQIGTVATGLGFGSVAYNEFIYENMKLYEEIDYTNDKGIFNPPTCVKMTTNLLRQRGLVSENRIQKINNVVVYPPEFFCPMKMGTRKIKTTSNTYSIHHYTSSWYTGGKIIREIKYRLIPLKIIIKTNILHRD